MKLKNVVDDFIIPLSCFDKREQLGYVQRLLTTIMDGKIKRPTMELIRNNARDAKYERRG